MAAELKVGIGVDATGLDTGLGKAQDQLKGFGKTAATETKKVGASFQGMSRVLSDAAFGPGAIANNLASLGDDFKQLSASAKESGQSLGKTLVNSLTGAGGLNLALGAVTLGMSLASFGLSAWTRMFKSNTDGIKDNKEELKKHNEELKDFVDNLGAVTQAQLKGAQNAQSELTSLKSLFDAYQNANLPLERRKDAYKQLQDQYPDYFKNISFEEKATKKTEDAYNRLTSSILATAQARAFNDKITKNTEEKLTLEEKEAKVAKELFQIKSDLAKAEEREFEASTKSEGQFAIATKRANDLRERKNELDQEYTQILKEQRGIVAQNAQLAERVQGLIGGGANIFDPKSDPATKIAKIDNKIKDLQWAKVIKGQAKDAELNIGNMGDVIKQTLDQIGRIQPNIQIPQALLDFNKTLKDKVVVPVLELGPTLTEGLRNALSGIGEALGNALVNGGNVLGALGQSLLASFGKILVELGQMLILTGTGIEAFKASLSSLTGLPAIAAGVALVALGTAISGSIKALGSGGGGGGASASASTAVPRGFQASTPSGFAGASAMGSSQFQFTLKGADLVASIDRTRSLNARQGAR